MTYSKPVRAACLILLAAIFLAACATKPESNLGIKGAPDWVNHGSQALKDDGNRYIYGIGWSPAMNDLSMQTSAADGRAHEEVARILSTFMRMVLQDYSTSAATGQDKEDKQSVSQQIESITNRNVGGSQIAAHWIDPESGTIWSLVKLDMNNVKAMVASSSSINAGFKSYFAGHADSVFDGMTNGSGSE